MFYGVKKLQQLNKQISNFNNKKQNKKAKFLSQY